jgi:hypothetical protein
MPPGSILIAWQGTRPLAPDLHAIVPGSAEAGQGNLMDVNAIIQQLREDQGQLEEAIAALGRLAAGRGHRRGRPLKWMTAAKAGQDLPKRRGRPPGKKIMVTGA